MIVHQNDTRGRPSVFGLSLASAPFDPHAPNLQNVLVGIPDEFDSGQPWIYFVFFHGMYAALEGQIIRMAVPGADVRVFDIVAQARAGSAQSITVVPQLTRYARSTAAGRLEVQGGFTAFMGSIAQSLRAARPDIRDTATAPIILAAFSGGHNALSCAMGLGPKVTNAGYAMIREPAAARICGIVLLDAIFRKIYLDTFPAWINEFGANVFLYCIYSTRPDEYSETLYANLDKLRPDTEHDTPSAPAPGLKPPMIGFRLVPTNHYDIPNDGPPSRPLEALLGNLALPRSV